MHSHKTKYTHGDVVYLKTDRDQLPRMIIAFTIRINNAVYYELGCGADSSFHFEFEISDVPDQLIKLNIEK